MKAGDPKRVGYIFEDFGVAVVARIYRNEHQHNIMAQRRMDVTEGKRAEHNITTYRELKIWTGHPQFQIRSLKAIDFIHTS